MKFICVLIMLLYWISCGDEDCCSHTSDAMICATFDMRQCHGNPWLGDSTRIPTSESDHARLVQDYLREQGVSADVAVDNDFHTLVCEACFVCPHGPRYEIQILTQDTTKIRELELLNIQFFSCE